MIARKFPTQLNTTHRYGKQRWPTTRKNTGKPADRHIANDRVLLLCCYIPPGMANNTSQFN